MLGQLRKLFCRFVFLRKITGHTNCIEAIAISRTMGDIASVSHTGKKHYVHTVFYSVILHFVLYCSYTMRSLNYPSLIRGIFFVDTGGSKLIVNTINAAEISSVATGTKIKSLCYSSCPEGVSINAIVGGTEDGSLL